MFMIKDYDEFDAIVNKIDQTCHIKYAWNKQFWFYYNYNQRVWYNFTSNKKIDCNGKSCTLVVIQSGLAQRILHVFMLLFEFNTDSDDNDLLSLYLILIKMDDFVSIMTLITATNATSTIIIQNDHNYVFLMITYVVMDISKLFYHFMTICQLVAMTIGFCISHWWFNF